MPILPSASETFLQGLSDFWTKLFADTPTLNALYQGQAVLIGQAYLDLLKNVLTQSVSNTPLKKLEYFKLLAIREDAIVHVEDRTGALLYSYDTGFPDIKVPVLQDKVFAATATLEPGLDYSVSAGTIEFYTDPVSLNNSPINFASRKYHVTVGNKFTASSVADWYAAGVRRGDVVRFLSVAPDSPVDYPVNLVRKDYLAGEVDSQFPAGIVGADWVVLRTIRDSEIQGEALPDTVADFYPPATVGPTSVINLAHSRIVKGTLVINARNTAGNAVVEGVDYEVDYEAGVITATSEWFSVAGVPYLTNRANYQWMKEVISGTADGDTAQLSSDLIVEKAFWCPDFESDEYDLYNHFGYLIGGKQVSTESYREYLRGVMQLHMLGPTITRLEAGLNAISSLPVVRTDGEVLAAYNSGVTVSGTNASITATGTVQDTVASAFSEQYLGGVLTITGATNPANNGSFLIISVTNSSTLTVEGSGFVAETGMTWELSAAGYQQVITNSGAYRFPLRTPIRADVKDPANVGVLSFSAFEPLTTAYRVVDYVIDETWWHDKRLPDQVGTDLQGSSRVAATDLRPVYVGAPDLNVGDPGFFVGGDELGQPTSNPYRHGTAFHLLDRYLKYHTFGVEFSSDIGVDGAILNQVRDLINESKPADALALVSSVTDFTDEVTVLDNPVSAVPGIQPVDVYAIYDTILLVGGNSWNTGEYITWREDLVIPLGPSTLAGSTVVLTSTPGERVVTCKITATAIPSTRNVAPGVDYEIDYTTNTLTRLTDWTNAGTAAALIVKKSVGIADTALGQTQIVVNGTEPDTARANTVSTEAPSIADLPIKITTI